MNNTRAILNHESALAHVTGSAKFIDDIPEIPGTLCAHVYRSTEAHARIMSYDIGEALKTEGVHAILKANDIPGKNNMGPVVHDETCLAESIVNFRGEAIFLIAADTNEACIKAASLIKVEYELLPAIFTIEEAIHHQSFFGDGRKISCGDSKTALQESPLLIEGEFRSGGQEHWYLETQACLCIPDENNEMQVFSSSQNPAETQSIIAEVLGLDKHLVRVEVKRMGGAFGGKETQAAHVAAWSALLAKFTGRPVKIRLNRRDDQKFTGKRHPFLTQYKAGFDKNGHLLAVEMKLFSNAGATTDLSWAIMERAMFHADNAYYCPNMNITAMVCKTNLPSNTAFRGFGGPQGMAVIEHIMDAISAKTGIAPFEVRKLNFYGNTGKYTHYGQEVKNIHLQRMAIELETLASLAQRQSAIKDFNINNKSVKRGLAVSPVKFGISFTTTHLNQAGALMNIYQDGSIMVSHGGTEMGQGLHTKIRQIAATELGIEVDKIRVSATHTDHVPNTSATAASSGTDLNGMAVQDAARKLKTRLHSIAVKLLKADTSPEKEICYDNSRVFIADNPEKFIPFNELIQKAYFERISLSATGFYKTPDIHFDKNSGKGQPFHYFAFGMAATEVEVDMHSGMVKILRTDILHDAGNSINPEIDKGQIAGGYIQGCGWCIFEEIKYDQKGNILNFSPDTYKIPTMGDMPVDFNIHLLGHNYHEGTIFGSKAVGEPPFMLALSAWLAIRQAIEAKAGKEKALKLQIPATNEAILRCILAE
ncbi:MAG: xanthine dehydrogenase molybdopterin binding subunit [Bacteroidales bacterium]|jgi:xanthine dehydrogenase molybdopterin binding subunit|nr:xanthine dehydrogenase molybdopterin binding subunit [Bacteroidales bacterium]